MYNTFTLCHRAHPRFGFDIFSLKGRASHQCSKSCHTGDNNALPVSTALVSLVLGRHSLLLLLKPLMHASVLNTFLVSTELKITKRNGSMKKFFLKRNRDVVSLGLDDLCQKHGLIVCMQHVCVTFR
jgi:hypothetical protein